MLRNIALAVAALLFAAVGLTASPATAGPLTEWWQGADYGAWSISNGNGEGFAQDNECDGHSVYLRVTPYTTASYPKWNIFDQNGCKAGVNWYSNNSVNYGRLCEQIPGDNNDLCTAWKWVQ